MKTFHFVFVGITEILFIGSLVEAVYLGAESESNIHVGGRLTKIWW